MNAKLILALAAAISAGTVAAAEPAPPTSRTPVAPAVYDTVAHSMTQWQAMADYVAGQVAPQLKGETAPWTIRTQAVPTQFSHSFAKMLTVALARKGVPLSMQAQAGGSVLEVDIASARFAPAAPRYKPGSLLALGGVGVLHVLLGGSPAAQAAAGIVGAEAVLTAWSKEPSPAVELSITLTAANDAGLIKAAQNDVFLVATPDMGLYEPGAARVLPLVGAPQH